MTKLPPPLPDRTSSETEPTKVILALAAIFLLVAILVIALVSQQGVQVGESVHNGDGSSQANGSGDTIDGQSSGDGKGEQDSEAEGEQPEDSPTGDNAEVDSVADSDEAAVSDESSNTNESSEAEEQSTVDDAVLALIETEAVQSKRSVRNTFNSFSGEVTPSKPARQTVPADEGTEAEFFGVAAEGQSFVFVVDKSGSMMGERLETARQELLDSIDQLRPNQEFYVIFFDSIFHEQPTKGMVRATPRNKKVVRDWIMNAVSSGGTVPYPAIEVALSLRPDVVYVLSDGEFSHDEVDRVKSINTDFTIPIHTIGFKINSQTLKDLAKQNRGQYRYVP